MREHTRAGLAAPNLIDLLALDDAEFKRRFAGTPILRSKRRGLLRNVCVALGNTADSTALPALRRAAADREPLVAEHAQWALRQIENSRGSGAKP
jgi:epoxyqueuosine reductase